MDGLENLTTLEQLYYLDVYVLIAKVFLQIFFSSLLRDDNDANCTYEGDNNVLLQQTSNWLLNAWKDKRFTSPFKSLNFLQDADKLLKTSFYLDDYTNLDNLLKIFQTLTTHLLVGTREKLSNCLENGLDEFQAKNESQFFMARTLSLSFIQMTMLDRFIEYINQDGFFEGTEKKVMKQIGAIYGLWCLEKHMAHLFQYQILISKAQ